VNTTQANLFSTVTTQSNIGTTSPPSTVSYNQPKLSPFAIWSANAITFADNSTLGWFPYSIFVTTNNTIYLSDTSHNRILIWSNNSINPMRTISGGLFSPWPLFVTANGDIYMDNGNFYGRVDKWTWSANTSIPAMYVRISCYGLFVDIKNTIYCSIYFDNRVVAQSLSSSSNTTTMVAGVGCAGSTSNMLFGPCGIFVDVNFDLYVADYHNDQIQLFRSGQLNGITVAGNTSSSLTIALYLPIGITLDASGYLFIVDRGNHRIVGSGPHGFRCLVGCSSSNGSASNQLKSPSALSFDTYGNMYVTDSENTRIQKFILLNASAGV
jgi:hypothetical protein